MDTLWSIGSKTINKMEPIASNTHRYVTKKTFHFELDRSRSVESLADTATTLFYAPLVLLICIWRGMNGSSPIDDRSLVPDNRTSKAIAKQYFDRHTEIYISEYRP